MSTELAPGFVFLFPISFSPCPYFSHLLLILFHLLPCIQTRCLKHILVQVRCILNKSCFISVLNVKNIYTKITSFFGMKTMFERKTVSLKIIQDSIRRSLEKEGKYVKDHSSPLLSFYKRSGYLSFYRKGRHLPKVSWLPDQCSLDQTILIWHLLLPISTISPRTKKGHPLERISLDSRKIKRWQKEIPLRTKEKEWGQTYWL